MFPTKEIEDKVLEFSENEDKAGLDEYAKTFDIALDRRKKFDNMVESFAKELDKLPKENFGSTEEEANEQTEPVSDGNDETIVDEEDSTEEDSDEAPKEKESDEDLDSEDEQSESEEPVGDFKSDFRPAFELTFSDSRYGGEYANVGYWIIDEIQNKRVIERQWSQEAIDECRHQKEILTILYYIEKNGSCLVRESRNSRFYRIRKKDVKVSG